MNFLVYCDVDENGIIIDAYYGVNIIPSRQYDYFFFLNEVIDDITLYKVNTETRELILT